MAAKKKVKVGIRKAAKKRAVKKQKAKGKPKKKKVITKAALAKLAKSVAETGEILKSSDAVQGELFEAIPVEETEDDFEVEADLEDDGLAN